MQENKMEMMENEEVVEIEEDIVAEEILCDNEIVSDEELPAKEIKKREPGYRGKVRAVHLESGEELIFKNIAEAAKGIDGKASQISKLMRGAVKAKQHHGYSFYKYEDNEPEAE